MGGGEECFQIWNTNTVEKSQGIFLKKTRKEKESKKTVEKEQFYLPFSDEFRFFLEKNWEFFWEENFVRKRMTNDVNVGIETKEKRVGRILDDAGWKMGGIYGRVHFPQRRCSQHRLLSGPTMDSIKKNAKADGRCQKNIVDFSKCQRQNMPRFSESFNFSEEKIPSTRPSNATYVKEGWIKSWSDNEIPRYMVWSSPERKRKREREKTCWKSWWWYMSLVYTTREDQRSRCKPGRWVQRLLRRYVYDVKGINNKSLTVDRTLLMV